MRTFLAAVALLVGACGQGGDAAQNSAAIELTARVVDEANLIDPAAEQRLIGKLAGLEASTSDQLVVVTLKTLNNQPIEKAALELGNRWGIGREDVDNGVLLVVAPNERKVRIEVGLGLEGLLTDEKAAAIIQQMTPEFRAGRMQDGINVGVDQIEALLESDHRRPQPKPLKKAA